MSRPAADRGKAEADGSVRPNKVPLVLPGYWRWHADKWGPVATREAPAAYGAERWLDELTQELKSRTYRPLPVRRVYIPGGNSVRWECPLSVTERWRCRRLWSSTPYSRSTYSPNSTPIGEAAAPWTQ